jgi:anti-sigma regulatory factor (Ser/Thr protein kinase)
MEAKCEYSSITIPNDPTYAAIAAKYVGEVATKVGYDEQDRSVIEHGVEDAISQVIEYSFEPGENATCDISCERVPEGLRISIRDEGLPLDIKGFSTETDREVVGQSSRTGAAIFSLKGVWDQVMFNNLGRSGKETVLIKHMKDKSVTDYYQTCDLGPYAKATEQEIEITKTSRCHVRPLESSDAAEVSKSVYKTYGYSYPYEHVYYPDRIVQLNNSGRMTSVVAVSDKGEVAGHSALLFWDDNTRIAEMSQGVVKPKFRTQGCFTRMTEYLIEKARSDGLAGIFARPVTNHTYSQKVGHAYGLGDCAVSLGYIPAFVNFKGMDSTPGERMSLLVQFLYLRKPSDAIVYAPIHHADIIAKLYQNLGVSPKIEKPDLSVKQPVETESVIEIHTVPSVSAARIKIDRYGPNVVREARTALNELRLQKIDLITLYLNLSDPLTFRFVEEFENMGFFFAGILPESLDGGDALILQFLNNVPVDYDKIRLGSTMGMDLLEYIKKHDPNVE